MCWVSEGKTPKVAFFGRKPAGAAALRMLLNLGWDITCVVVPDRSDPDWMPRPHVKDVAAELDLKVFTQRELLKEIQAQSIERPDFLISYLYSQRVLPETLRFPKTAAINFHSAPLPELGGWGVYIHAILADYKSYGVSCHIMTENFDEGAIIGRRDFPIDPSRETSLSLERKSQPEMLILFHDVCRRIMNGESIELDTRPLQTYVSRVEVASLQAVPDDCPPDELDKRARAFWYPPYSGAYLASHGEDFTIAPASALADIGNEIHHDTFQELWQLARTLLDEK